jgi:hypothetical protein
LTVEKTPDIVLRNDHHRRLEMTPELWKTIRPWLDIVAFIASILTVLTFVLTYWAVAVPFIPTILKYGWPLIAAYAAFRLYQFGRSLYQRFTRLELDVFGNAVDVDTRFDEQAKAHQDRYDEIVKLLHQEMQKRREETKEREELEVRVAELENKLFPEKEKQARRQRIAELLTIQQNPEMNPQAASWLADNKLADGLLALGAPKPK